MKTDTSLERAARHERLWRLSRLMMVGALALPLLAACGEEEVAEEEDTGAPVAEEAIEQPEEPMISEEPQAPAPDAAETEALEPEVAEPEGGVQGEAVPQDQLNQTLESTDEAIQTVPAPAN